MKTQKAETSGCPVHTCQSRLTYVRAAGRGVKSVGCRASRVFVDDAGGSFGTTALVAQCVIDAANACELPRCVIFTHMSSGRLERRGECEREWRCESEGLSESAELKVPLLRQPRVRAGSTRGVQLARLQLPRRRARFHGWGEIQEILFSKLSENCVRPPFFSVSSSDYPSTP